MNRAWDGPNKHGSTLYDSWACSSAKESTRRAHTKIADLTVIGLRPCAGASAIDIPLPCRPCAQPRPLDDVPAAVRYYWSGPMLNIAAEASVMVTRAMDRWSPTLSSESRANGEISHVRAFGNVHRRYFVGHARCSPPYHIPGRPRTTLHGRCQPQWVPFA